MRKKIALDVDGVLLNFMPVFDKAAEMVLGYKPTIYQDEFNMDHYYLTSRINVDQSKIDEILDYMLETRMYANIPALKGAKEAIEKIKEEDFDIYIVTALPERAKEMRLENLLNELNLVPKEIFCVGMGLSKGDALKLLRPDIFIDDRIEYLASGPDVFHLAWIDQREVQKDKDSLVHVHVHSLEEWVKNYLPRISAELDNHYNKNHHLQTELKLENVKRKYSK